MLLSIICILQAEDEAILDSLDDDYHLPINHRPSQSIDMSRCEMATMDRPIPVDNLGHRMLLRLGWKVGSPASPPLLPISAPNVIAEHTTSRQDSISASFLISCHEDS